MLRISVLAILLIAAGCGAPGGTDFEQYLYHDENKLVRYIDGNALFTGEAYSLVCEECAEPLFGNWPVHFVGQYKDGVPNGAFWIPKSGSQDDYFQYRDRATQKQLIYEHGKVIDDGV